MKTTRPLVLLLSFAQIGLWGQTGLTLSSTGTPLAAYRAFFHHVQYLQSEAQKATFAEALELQSWHQKHIGLTSPEAAQLKQLAATHVSSMDAIEKQAAQIIQAQHAQFSGGRLASRDSLPPPLPELSQLQKQRDDLTTAHIQTLQAGLSSASFSKLDSWVKANFNQRATKVASFHPAPPAQAVAPGVAQ